nr:hypothetical protein [uncultured Trichococcus sp.]
MKYERTITLIFFTPLIAMLVNVHGIRQTVIKQKYEKQLEVQQAEYQHAVIDLRQELHDAKFQLDMATDHIELINAGH